MYQRIKVNTVHPEGYIYITQSHKSHLKVRCWSVIEVFIRHWLADLINFMLQCGISY